MPVGIADFIKIPKWAKYVVLIAVVLGATIEIPLTGLINVFDLGTNVSIGDIFFAPFAFALGHIGIGVDFKSFTVLIILSIVLIGMLSMQKGGT